MAEGSTGRTYQQLANVLRLPADLTRIRMVYRYLLSALAENHTAVELTMNQVLFCDINRPIDIDFQEKLEHVYDADYYPVNFMDSIATAGKINAYVKQQTQGRIDEIIQSNDLKMVHMLLVSAIFFQGRWKVRNDQPRWNFLESKRKSILNIFNFFPFRIHFVPKIREFKHFTMKMIKKSPTYR